MNHRSQAKGNIRQRLWEIIIIKKKKKKKKKKKAYYQKHKVKVCDGNFDLLS